MEGGCFQFELLIGSLGETLNLCTLSHVEQTLALYAPRILLISDWPSVKLPQILYCESRSLTVGRVYYPMKTAPA